MIPALMHGHQEEMTLSSAPAGLGTALDLTSRAIPTSKLRYHPDILGNEKLMAKPGSFAGLHPYQAVSSDDPLVTLWDAVVAHSPSRPKTRCS